MKTVSSLIRSFIDFFWNGQPYYAENQPSPSYVDRLCDCFLNILAWLPLSSSIAWKLLCKRLISNYFNLYECIEWINLWCKKSLSVFVISVNRPTPFHSHIVCHKKRYSKNLKGSLIANRPVWISGSIAEFTSLILWDDSWWTNFVENHRLRLFIAVGSLRDLVKFSEALL